jgi:hypothetical protein
MIDTLVWKYSTRQFCCSGISQSMNAVVLLITDRSSSPWRNHDFLSDEICIGDSGDFDDDRVVTKKKKSLVHA